MSSTKGRGRRLIGALSAALVAGGLFAAVGPAAPASAAESGVNNGCDGTLLGSWPLRDPSGDIPYTSDGHPRVELWYSPANNGTNCVQTVHPDSWGSKWTLAAIRSGDGRGAEDQGWYYHYAGGAYLTDMNGECVQAIGKFRTSTVAGSPVYQHATYFEWCG